MARDNILLCIFFCLRISSLSLLLLGYVLVDLTVLLFFLLLNYSYVFFQKSKSTSDVPSKVSKEVNRHKDGDLFSTEQVLKRDSPPDPENVPAYWV